jgi:hypothetical protein
MQPAAHPHDRVDYKFGIHLTEYTLGDAFAQYPFKVCRKISPDLQNLRPQPRREVSLLAIENGEQGDIFAHIAH